ncbi:MAG: GAF and ANTAR domain-containing protein [Acidimicrobiales bacterium]
MDARAAALSALAQFQVTQMTVGDALQRIADITLDAVPAAAIVGMSMLGDDGQPTTAVYTDDRSPTIDEAQYREGKGPCLDAWRHNAIYRIPRIEASVDEYPAFASACLDHGVRSTLSLPMSAGDLAVGAVNLYSKAPDGFDEEDESLSADLAAAGGAVLANVSAYWTAFELGEHLNEAMRSRAVIEQAKGILMAGSAGLTADEAFDMLRHASQRENIKLREIAARIVDGRARPGESS